MSLLTEMYGEQKLVEDMGEFINHFLDTRFQNLPDDWRILLADVCITMFEAGASWSDNASGRNEPSKIILTGSITESK